MHATDTVTLVVTLIANVLGVAVLARMWSRSRRGRSVERTRHPSVRPPVAVELVERPPWSRLCITAAPTAPPVAIDIVSYRRARPAGPWESEPIRSPITVEPGGRAELGATLPAGSAADVVVAWTARHSTGEVQSSHLFRLPPERDVAVVRPRAGALPGRVALAVAGLVVGAALLATASWLDRDDATPSEATAGSVPDQPPAATAPPPPAGTTAATNPLTSDPASDESSPSTTTEPTTAPTTAPTAAPTTEPTTAPTAEPSSEGAARVVAVSARVEPCRFGDDCLVVGFVLDGFTNSPQEYVCEFEDGSRFTFRFDSDGVDTACATGAAAAAITVEVDGVRSVTVTRDDA